MSFADLLSKSQSGAELNEQECLTLEQAPLTTDLLATAATLRDRGFGSVVTYSKKVFLPLTHLCRDVCHYCTFAKTPKKIGQPYMTMDQVLKVADEGARLGCKEALFTLGERPEDRYDAARKALTEMGFASTLEYLRAVAERVAKETGLLPHLNPGTMTLDELKMLRGVSASMGIMLESASPRLSLKGMPHYGSPDKVPEVRLRTLRNAGEARVPFTTGILIGIGETRRERIESLLAIREIHQQYGHIQEIIVQNFRAKPNTKMAKAPEPDLNEMLWTLAVARLIFGATMSIQAPPNLSPGGLKELVDAGINDWGGVSPLTPDFVNPEAPWPHLKQLADDTARAGKWLDERITIYPRYALDLPRWVDAAMHTAVLNQMDGEGLGRVDDWCPGSTTPPPSEILNLLRAEPAAPLSADVTTLLAKVERKELLTEQDVMRMFAARGADFAAICSAANKLREQSNGNVVSFVVNRNINYTNVCYFKCQFCAFSKGKLTENLRGRPYDLSLEEIQRRTVEAWDRGATEVCMQGGIHPEYTGETYINIVHAVKAAVPEMHVHAFSPLEVWQGAATSNLDLEAYLTRLKAAGLGTLPGTAAEVLDDEVRQVLCPDKINTAQWFQVMETAHKVGFRTTATIMYGHVERYEHWARHLLRIRDLQMKTGGFTEFVPLPYVHMEAPIYLKGKSRKGPTFREAVLMHAIARLTLHPYITNIQASWVKMGHKGVMACLNAGANDLGGTLMNESITRAAGAEHGQETSPPEMIRMIEAAGRIPRQRSTAYGAVNAEIQARGMVAEELAPIVNTPAPKYDRDRHGPKKELIRPGFIKAVNL